MKIISLGGGVGEIGGNKFIFEHGKTRILLDIGMSFGQAGKYFSEFMQPRQGAGLRDYFELGLLPDVKSLYRNDVLKHMGRESEKKGFDAVFISHAHADHAAYLHFVRDDIPVICTKATKVILQALEETGAKSEDYITVLSRFTFYTNDKGGISKVTRATCGKHPEFLTCRKFITDEKVKINDLELHIVPVDHSLPGAAALIIKTKEGNFVYSGDIRFHGTKSDLSDKFVEIAAKAKPKLMMCEGTRINEEKGETEEDVREKADQVVSKTKELAIVSFPVRDIDRLSTFLEVAKDNRRFLTISMKQAYLLELMEKEGIDAPRVSDKNIKIYVPRKEWGLIKREGTEQKMKESEYESFERPYIGYKNAVFAEDIRKDQKKYLLQLNAFEINQLIDIKPNKGSTYIHSTCEPFDEKMEMDAERLNNWLSHFNIDRIYQIHASGHAAGQQLRDMLGKIKPDVLIPIHTEHPELFKVIAPKGTEIEFIKAVK